MNCLWKIDATDPRIKTCSRPGCNNRVVTDYPPEKCYAHCRGKKSACVHLGAELRRADCPTCSGNVQVKIFACAARGECTTAKAIDGVPCCLGCTEYRAADATVEPGPPQPTWAAHRWRLSFPRGLTRYPSLWLVDRLDVDTPEGQEAFGLFVVLAADGPHRRADLVFERRADGREHAAVEILPAGLCWSSGWLSAGSFEQRQELHDQAGELPPVVLETAGKRGEIPPAVIEGSL